MFALISIAMNSSSKMLKTMLGGSILMIQISPGLHMATLVGVDVKDGKVATHGWESVSQYPALEFCRMMADMGVKTIVYTDISRDGMLAGPNLAQTREISEETGVDVIASGGVSSLKDLNEISQAGIHGAIIGKALYEKRIDLREAVRMFEGRTI